MVSLRKGRFGKRGLDVVVFVNFGERLVRLLELNFLVIWGVGLDLTVEEQ